MAQNNDQQATGAAPSHYVGIGASAGGLEAIEKFITNMPVQNQLAFIIVQHLSPDYKSLMVELLAKKTEIPVHRAEEGMEVLMARKQVCGVGGGRAVTAGVCVCVLKGGGKSYHRYHWYSSTGSTGNINH